MKYNDNGTYKDIYVKTFDTLPTGAEVDYDGSVVPDGWTEIPSANVITLNLTSNSSVTISTSYGVGRIPLNNIFTQIGDKLTFDSTNHTIVIGAGVHHIEVNAHCTLSNGTSSQSDRYLSIRNITKNNGIIGQALVQNTFSSGTIYQLTITPTVAAVDENDIIEIVVASGHEETLGIKGSSSPRTILTVKVID